jgi:hypothetical protein
VDPRRNPSYPRRVHIHERAHWQEVLRSCEEKIAPYRQKLKVLSPSSPDRPRFERLFAQLLGSRDQVADAARRLPGEVGEMYEEDHHRLHEGLAALDRVLARWDGK